MLKIYTIKINKNFVACEMHLKDQFKSYKENRINNNSLLQYKNNQKYILPNLIL